jgi:hypothetical protein
VTREYERVRCPACGRTVAAYVPHMGDGTGLRTMKHNTPVRVIPKECRGSRRIIVLRAGQWELES